MKNLFLFSIMGLIFISGCSVEQTEISSVAEKVESVSSQSTTITEQDDSSSVPVPETIYLSDFMREDVTYVMYTLPAPSPFHGSIVNSMHNSEEVSAFMELFVQGIVGGEVDESTLTVDTTITIDFISADGSASVYTFNAGNPDLIYMDGVYKKVEHPSGTNPILDIINKTQPRCYLIDENGEEYTADYSAHLSVEEFHDEGILGSYSSYSNYISPTELPYSRRLLITTDLDISNVVYVEGNIDTYNNLVGFRVNSELMTAHLSPTNPMAVEMQFYGDLPTNAIMFRDVVGDLRIFSIGMSGMDGSILLFEEKPI